MKRIALSLVLLFVSAAAAAAQIHGDTVKVYVVVASGGSAYKAISLRTEEISAKTRNNIVVTFVHVRPDDFQHFVRTETPIDIVICDSAEQLKGNPSLKRDAENGVDVCGGAGSCIAFINSSVTADRKAAVQQVFQNITRR